MDSGERLPMKIRVPRPPGFRRPERDAPPSTRPTRTVRATVETIEDANGYEVVIFDPMGRSAVERMTNVTYTGGDRGRTLVHDSTTDAHCLLDFMAGSSGVDTLLLRGAKEGCPHATPVLLKWLGDAFAAFRPTLGGTVYLTGVLGHAETTAGGTRLAAVHALAKSAPNVVVLEKLFSRDEPLLEKPPYDNAVGRKDFYEELEVTVHEAELSKCDKATLVLFDWVVDSGEKSKFFRAEAANLAEALGKDVQIVVIAAGKRVGAARRTPTAAALSPDFLRNAKAAVALSLADQGLRSTTEGVFGGGIYKIDVQGDLEDVDNVAKVYGGSAKAGLQAWKARGELLCDAVDKDDAVAARLQADLLMEARGSNHQSAARRRKKPEVFLRMWDACVREVGEDFHVSQRMRCVAFIISFEGETEAEFYQRLLKLEQGLLDYLFDLMDRRQLYIANSDRQACGLSTMVRDVDGSWVRSNQTLAAKQKAAATRAASRDSEYVACITDLLTAADAGAEAEALRLLLDRAERVDETATAERPELRLERADAEFVAEATRWSERAAEGDEADDARAVLEAATAVTSATPDAKASERFVRDELHGAAAETWPVLQSRFIPAALKETHLELCGVVDREQGGKKVLPANTREALRRRAATIAAKTCVPEAATAVAAAQADGNDSLVAAARAYSVAATDLRDAYPEKKGDAHILLRAAAASYRASVASAKAVGDDAAVAQKLVEASNAFDVAAKAVVDAVDFDAKLARRQDLAATEDAFENLYKPHKPTKPAPPRKPRARKTARRRRKRCGVCEGCLAEECGTCKYCVDMPKRGGPGKLNNQCLQRECLTMKAARLEDLAAARDKTKASEADYAWFRAFQDSKRRGAPAAPAPAAPAPRPPAAIAGTFKVIDPAGAKVFNFWEDTQGGYKEVAHLAQGTSVDVTAERGRQVRIVEPQVGCVFLESLERVEPVASAPDASPMPAPAAPAPDVEAPAAPAPDNDDDDDDDELERGALSSGVTARVVARRRGLVEEAPESPAAPAPDDLQAPAAPAPAPGDAEMAEAPETQDQANARRRDEITAQLDRLKLIDPNTYTTVVASFLGIARGAVDDATRRGVAL